MKIKLLIFALLVWLIYSYEGTVTYGPGVMAPNAPVQMMIVDAKPFAFKGYTLTPLATFRAEARVLSKETYRWDREAELSPVDWVLGWGKMSDESVLKVIDVHQSGRWYHWRSEAPPIPIREIETHSANMHMIPSNPEVAKAIKRVRQGDIVRIDGMLIQAQGANGTRWISSLTRNDTVGGACEVVYLKSVVIVYR